MEPCKIKRCCKDECGKDAKVSSLGYVVGIGRGMALVIREDNSLVWCHFFPDISEKEIVDGDFVRVYKRKCAGVYRYYARYALYLFSPKDVATATVILDLGWQVQKARLPYSEEADKLFLRSPCLEVKKQLEPAAPE